MFLFKLLLEVCYTQYICVFSGFIRVCVRIGMLYSVYMCMQWLYTCVCARIGMLYSEAMNKAIPKSTTVHEIILIYQQALFLLIFCSILQGSFLTYVNSTVDQVYIASILYFIRLFSDLFGRCVALYMKGIFTSIRLVYYIILFRAVCMIYFFVYIAYPGVIYQSNTFMYIYQVLYIFCSHTYIAPTYTLFTLVLAYTLYIHCIYIHTH